MGYPPNLLNNRKVDLLTDLIGAVIADPGEMEGVEVYCAENTTYYQLSLNSNATIDPPFVVATILGGATRWLAISAIIGSITFGSGEDGVAVFNGVHVFPFAVLAGTTYTLSRDVYLADGSSVSLGIAIKTNGFRLFCNGRLINTGTISNNGDDAVLGAHGAAAPNGTLWTGTDGGDGGNAGVGAPGVNQTNGLEDASAHGGDGGAGGVDAGGLGGTYAASTAVGDGSNFLVPILLSYVLNQAGGVVSAGVMGGGAGGGGGGSDNAGVTGGGGGGGGGVMGIHCYSLQNDGVIEANGGKGADASGAGGNGGGGGGAGGGLINSLCRYRFGTGVMRVLGGAGGAPVAAGVAGVAGAAGHINAFAA